jgi:subtilase-type serine protease
MSVPASGNISGKVTATFDVADIFGNAVSETVTVTTLGGATAGSVTADALVPGRYSADITLPAAAGTVAVGATIPNPTSVPTIKLAKVSQTAIVTVSDLASTLADVNAALAAEKAARAADKVVSDKALADAVAKAAADAAAAKSAADAAALTAAAEIAKLKADAVTAKLTADKALADAAAAHATELAKVKADNDAAIAAMKKAFNALAAKWNKANPKAKVALVK